MLKRFNTKFLVVEIGVSVEILVVDRKLSLT